MKMKKIIPICLILLFITSCFEKAEPINEKSKNLNNYMANMLIEEIYRYEKNITENNHILSREMFATESKSISKLLEIYNQITIDKQIT